MLLFTVWIISIIYTSYLAKKHKKSTLKWVLFSVLLGPFSLFILLIILMKERKQKTKLKNNGKDKIIRNKKTVTIKLGRYKLEDIVSKNIDGSSKQTIIKKCIKVDQNQYNNKYIDFTIKNAPYTIKKIDSQYEITASIGKLSNNNFGENVFIGSIGQIPKALLDRIIYLRDNLYDGENYTIEFDKFQYEFITLTNGKQAICPSFEFKIKNELKALEQDPNIRRCSRCFSEIKPGEVSCVLCGHKNVDL